LLGRDTKKCIIIDNLKENFELQRDNGIEIVSFYDDPNDKELERLVPFLRGIVEADVRDVRPLIKLQKAEAFQRAPIR
jgi:CTD small phosphatase-like protein 2